MSEHDEAVVFAEWLAIKGIPHWHVKNENTIRNPAYIGKMKRAGWNPGIADYFIVIPKEKSRYGRALALWVELKKPKKILKRASTRGAVGDAVPDGSSGPTEDQLRFIDLVRSVNDTEGRVCYGAVEATSFVSSFVV